MVPNLKGELPPPPLGAELRPTVPWELCSTTASWKEASIAADVRPWGGGGNAGARPRGRQ